MLTVVYAMLRTLLSASNALSRLLLLSGKTTSVLLPAAKAISNLIACAISALQDASSVRHTTNAQPVAAQ